VDTQRRLEDLPRSRPLNSALEFGRPGVHPEYSIIGEVRPCAGSDPPLRGIPGDGGDEETRTPDPLLAKEMLCQLSYVPLPRANVVGVSGLEPETSALSGQCSNQLS
jgi:hypothetical protein